jgi:hypothetical protein
MSVLGCFEGHVEFFLWEKLVFLPGDLWMSTTPAERADAESKLPELVSGELGKTRGVIAWSSFFFALLQSICTFFVAVNGLRLAIGAGALISAGFGANLDRFHHSWLRLPMLSLALLGSVVNIAVLIQIRVLRNRPASRWRQRPLSAGKIRMERMQWVLSILTLVLLGVEEYLHLKLNGQV